MKTKNNVNEPKKLSIFDDNYLDARPAPKTPEEWEEHITGTERYYLVRTTQEQLGEMRDKAEHYQNLFYEERKNINRIIPAIILSAIAIFYSISFGWAFSLIPGAVFVYLCVEWRKASYRKMCNEISANQLINSLREYNEIMYGKSNAD